MKGSRGMALVSAFIIALVAVIAIAIMYYIVGRTFSSNTVIATYSSVRDATEGCVKYAVSLLLQGTFNEELVAPGDCVGPYEIAYQIREVGQYTMNLSICYSAYVGRDESPLPLKGNVYTIVCETKGELRPRQASEGIKTPTVYSRLEAIYIP